MKDIFSLGAVLGNWTAIAAHLATVIGIVVAYFGARIALNTYKSNNSIKKWELIENIFSSFIKDGWYEFYKRIQNGDQIDFENKDNEKLLNETLTLFDTLNYFQRQKLLDEEAWEYFSCEILNFALNNSVWKYMEKVKKLYLIRGFREDIIPFTGFPELFDNIPPKFRLGYSQFEKQFKMLSPDEQISYFAKVRDIPDKRKQLKRAAAIALFATHKEDTIPEAK